MPAELQRPARPPLAFRGTTLGEVAMAAFVVCAITGALLIPAYDAHGGRESIAQWLLTNPGAVFVRNVHYWTAQLSLVATLLHLWDHLRLGTERRVAAGVWLRLVLSLPVLAFLMLSGFMLRGDADAAQAQRILTGVIAQVPLVGPLAATFLFGVGDTLHVLYAQHGTVATFVVWLVIIEHTRRLWPRAVTLATAALGVSALSLVLSPGLHDGFDQRMKGPWYFLGLQEILHWTSWPSVVVACGVAGVALLWILPRLQPRHASRAKRGLLLTLGVYAVLCGVGLFLRGENWSPKPNWPNAPSDLKMGWIFAAHGLPLGARNSKMPVVMGRPEGCLVCHAGITGLGDSHRPESIGCASCHAGDANSLDARRAHAGMIRVPGNLADAARSCGQAACHATVIPRVERSIMTTFAGVIDVNRRVFGESSPRSTAPASDVPPHVRDLGASTADSHLRQLCASCHLGQRKIEWGAIGEDSRGGGCNACHLVYDTAAARQLAAYLATPVNKRTNVPPVHPRLTIAVDNAHCFGCHSRSARISTNYEGWHELRFAPSPAQLAADSSKSPRQFRLLEDGRYFTKVTADIHQTRGMDCVDCHSANEVMGKGAVVAHARDQVRIRCEDCHTRRFVSAAPAPLDAETVKLLGLRQWTLAPSERLAATSSGDVLVNVVVNTSGHARMRHKRTGQWAELRPPLSACTRGQGHARLSCISCHTPWAPQCTTCHTSFDRAAQGFDHVAQKDVQGSWQESSGPFDATAPALGVRTNTRDAAHPTGVVETFIPGMILELDRNRSPDGRSDVVFRRLFSRTFSHTITRASRTCESCHNDPVALGFGRGVLRFARASSATSATSATNATNATNATSVGRWSFAPASARSSFDGLPADAWTGFLQTRQGMVSTRDDVRPFNVEEQRRILTVGACLTCHAGTSTVMRLALEDFAATVARRTRSCVLPVWP